MGCGAAKASPGAILATINTGLLNDSPTGGKGYCGGIAFCQGEGGKVYYMAGNKGMAVVDVADPRAPAVGERIDTGAISSESGVALVRVGSVLYVAGGKGLQVFDVSDASRPAKEGDLIITGVLGHGSGVALAVSGSTLYAAGDKGLAVYSIEDPKKPVQVGDTIDTGVLQAVSGASLLVADLQPAPMLFVAGYGGLAAFEISDPQKPSKVCSTKTAVISSCSGCDLCIRGSTLYVAGGGGVVTVDISTPKDLKVTGEVVKSGATAWTSDTALLLSEKDLLVAGGNGLAALAVSEAAPTVAKGVTSTGVLSSTGCAGIAEVGGLIYVAGGKGLAVVDKAAYLS